jgi:PAS domain S-box-containing protein
MKKTEVANGGQFQRPELRRKAEKILSMKKKVGTVETPAEKDALALVHELQVHQIELEMQNQELLDARATSDELSIKYMELFDFAPIGFFLWDEQGKILELNLAGAIMLGLERGTAFKKRFGQFVALEDRPIFADFCKNVMLAKTKQTCEIKLSTGEKTSDVLIEGIAGRYGKGEELLCRAAVVDITQRKQFNSLLKLRRVSEAVMGETDLETMLQQIVEAADDLIGARIIVTGFNFADDSFTVGPTSPAARDMLNAPEKRIPLAHGMLYIELIVKEGIVRLSEQDLRRYYNWSLPPGHPPLRGLLGTKLTGADGRAEGLIVLSDKASGGDFTADDQIILAQLGNIASLALRNIDARRRLEDRADELAAANWARESEIAAHVKTEAALRESEIRFRTMAEYTFDWEHWTGPDERSPVYISPSCQRISGYSPQEFFDNPDLMESIVHADDRQIRAEHVRQTHDNPNPLNSEYRIISKDGKIRWIEHVCQSVYGPDGQCLGRRASNRDVTDRKVAEQALCASIIEAQHQAEAAKEAMEAVRHLARFPQENPNPVLRIDRDGTILYANPVSGPFLAYWSLAQGKRLPDDWRRQLAEIIEAGKTMEYEMVCADKTFSCLLAPIAEEGYVNIYGRDITEKKTRGERIARLTKLYAVLSRVNEAIVRIHDEQSLFQEVCRIIAEEGEFPLVWLGQIQDGCVVPTAQCGPAADYLNEIRVELDGELGKGPTGTCIREDRLVVNDDFNTNSSTAPWRENALKNGFRASAAFPLHRQGAVIGSMTIYAAQPGVFDAEQVRLLEALSADISYALDKIWQEQLRSKAEEELRLAKEAAEAANRAKSLFFANISHDLRTPMNAILGMTELALAETTDPAVKDYLKTTKESADVLLELLNQVLDLSRMESGKLQLEIATFNLRTTLGQTLKILEMRAHEKGLLLNCSVSDDVPDSLTGDPMRLRQVLMNLVGNAVKFTQRGKVDIQIEVVSRSDKDVQLKFLVADSGIGISPEDQERIFVPFTQAGTSTSRIYGGTGLGLTIASNLVELMGGRIWVESILGKGSKFHFTVRLGIATAPVTPPEQPVGESLFMEELPPAVKPLRILLAEDNPASQKLAQYVLNKRGHQVQVAQNGRDAVERVISEDLDAVLMDIHMLVMDGFQATAAIRALPDPVKARLPIIAMTASAMKGDQERCLAAGMDGYLSKPMSANDLITLVERLGAKTPQSRANAPEVRAARVRENRSSPPTEDDINRIDPPQPIPAPPSDAFNLDEAIKRCFGKYSLFQDMVGCLFDESNSLLEQMRLAVSSENGEELGFAAHRLKGTVAFLGASPAAAASLHVEQIGQSGKFDVAPKAIDQLQTQIELLKKAVAPHLKKGDITDIDKLGKKY